MNPDRDGPPPPEFAEKRSSLKTSGTTLWLAIPIGFLLSGLGVFVLEPMLVDFIFQDVFELPEGTRMVPMLTLDLVLNTATQVGAASSGSLPAWYQWSSYASIAVAWLVAGVLHGRVASNGV